MYELNFGPCECNNSGSMIVSLKNQPRAQIR